MIFRRPPALANWLLDRLGYARQNAALSGDLLEEFRNGRSAAWYWRQILGVIANGISHNGIVLRPYLGALTAAYAAQFVVVLALWSLYSPPSAHAALWLKVALYVLAQFTFAGCELLVNRSVVGVAHPNVKRMYCAPEPGRPRSTILALAAYHSFHQGFASYCICALVFPRFSLANLAGLEMTWFVLWVFTPALIPSSAPPTTAEAEEEGPAWPQTPEREPTLAVALSNGSTVNLQWHSLAQSVFAAADRELTAVVFGKRRSLELLRRAIWLGGCRSRAFPRERRESLTLAELGALIEKTAQTASVVSACHDSNRREGFWQRLRLGFRGDPA